MDYVEVDKPRSMPTNMFHHIQPARPLWGWAGICLSSLACFLVACVMASNAHADLWENNPFAVFYLGDLGDGKSYAWGMNNLGEVVGSSYTTDGYLHAFAWRNGTMQDLGTLDAEGLFSRARDVNDLGQIVGVTSMDGDVPDHAFLWEDGVMSDLGSLDDLGGSQAWGVSNTGFITGTSRVWDGMDWVTRGFLWYGGSMSELYPLDLIRSSKPYDVNNLGQAVGQSSTEDRRVWAGVIWEPDGSITDMGGGETGDTLPEGINDLGQVVGQGPKTGHAFLWNKGTWYDLHEWLKNYDASAARAVNNLTQVVGWIGNTAFTTDACYWDLEHGQVLLNDLLPPKSHWRLRYGNDINDLGQIAGTGNYKNNDWSESQAFLMSPVYPSFDLGSAEPGIAGQVNTITASNLEPGAKVYFTYSSHSGATLIPGCDVTRNALQLENAKVAGAAIADADGEATLEGVVPSGMADQWLLFQAVVPNQCAISNLVVQKFE